MPLFIANWKMYLSYQEAISFVQDHGNQLEQLSSSSSQIIIAPSFVCLDAFKKLLTGTKIKLAAQDCAPFKSGAYTGEVDAISLAQIGCTYAIVGHSERRQHFGETNEMIAAKATQLFENNIAPIICIGESKLEYENGKTLGVLATQLAPIFPLLNSWNRPYCIAYEPMWSIGTGNVATPEQLNQIFQWLIEQVKFDPNCTLIYGGSVNEENATNFLTIPNVGGLLIGSASCNFQTMKKIVSLA